MQRIVEPELMNDKAQVEAYAAADFEQANKLIINAFDYYFSGAEINQSILDLGCGPGNITFQVARRFPDCHVFGVDGSTEMIRLANERSPKFSSNSRISFITGVIPGAAIPQTHYSAIVSNSFLHHLHQPKALWETINLHSSSGTKILIADLFRPPTKEDAINMVKKYAKDEPKILQRDFYNSLLAAFTPKEIEQQLVYPELTQLKVEIIIDRHLLVVGEKS